MTRPKHGRADVTEISDVYKAVQGKPEHIAKVSEAVLETITKRMMRDNPGISKAKARIMACGSPEYSEAHRQEKLLKFGQGY